MNEAARVRKKGKVHFQVSPIMTDTDAITLEYYTASDGPRLVLFSASVETVALLCATFRAMIKERAMIDISELPFVRRRAPVRLTAINADLIVGHRGSNATVSIYGPVPFVRSNESTNGSTWTTTESRTSNTVNEITNISTGANIAYDVAGNMTMIPQIGVTPTSPTISYWETLAVADWASMTVAQWSGLLIVPELVATYDAWNRLIQLTDLASGNTAQRNQYDARNFRTMILTYSGGTISETRHSYYSSNWRCLEERTGSPPTTDRQFVWGVRYIDDLILRDRPSERLYALQDSTFNVTSVAATSGTIEERYFYAAYGSPGYLTGSFGARSTSSYAWETLFCGYRFDNTLLYMVRNRVYAPRLGFWTQRDPFAYIEGLNLYEYVGSSPLLWFDGFGLAAKKRTKGIKDCSELLNAGAGEIAEGILKDEAHEWKYFKRWLKDSQAPADPYGQSPQDLYDNAMGYKKGHDIACKKLQKIVDCLAEICGLNDTEPWKTLLPLLNTALDKRCNQPPPPAPTATPTPDLNPSAPFIPVWIVPFIYVTPWGPPVFSSPTIAPPTVPPNAPGGFVSPKTTTVIGVPLFMPQFMIDAITLSGDLRA